MAEHGHVVLHRLRIFLAREEAAQRRLDPQEREVVPGDQLTSQTLGVVLPLPFEVHREVAGAVDRHLLEDAVLPAPVLEVHLGDGPVLDLALLLESAGEHHEARGVAVGELFQQQCVHDGEHGARRANAQRQSQNSRRGEAGTLQQLAQAEPQISQRFSISVSPFVDRQPLAVLSRRSASSSLSSSICARSSRSTAVASWATVGASNRMRSGSAT